VVVLGPESVEVTELRAWGRERGVRVVCGPLENARNFDVDAADLVVLDALENPALAIAECAFFHRARPILPLLFLSPIGPELESAALRAGATVYLARPLAAARLRRYADRFAVGGFAPRSPAGVLVDDGVVLDLEGRRLFVDGCERPLTPDTFALLQYFVEHPGRAIAARELLRNGIFAAGQGQRYRAAVFELRRRLGKAARTINVVRGYGYRYDPPVAETDRTSMIRDLDVARHA